MLSDGRISQIARGGDPAPGGGAFEYFFGVPSLNAAGQVAVAAGLLRENDGVFLISGGEIIKVARPGDPAPGGGTIIFADTPSLNAKGQIAFPANTSTTGFGAFLFTDGSVTKIARAGDAAPGGGTFTYADLPKLNDLGQAAFVSGLSRGGAGAFLATLK